MKNTFASLALSLLFLAGCSTPTTPAQSENKDVSSDTPTSSQAPEVWEEQLSDGGLTASSPDQVSLFDKGHEDGGYTFYIALACSWSNTTSINALELKSSDPSILPNNALSVSYNLNTSTGLIQDPKIEIKRSAILKTGTFSIKAHLKSANTSNEGTVVRKLTAVPFGEVKRTTYHETVQLDWSALTLSDVSSIIFQFWDKDFEYGLKNPNITESGLEYRDFWQCELKDETTQKKDLSFAYFVGHRYSLTFTVKTTYGSMTNYKIADAVGEGDTTTGFNQYKDYYLTFVKDASSLPLVITTTVVH
jgi:hypothetical protein